jgi:ABC-type multidrug transport system fused ATPase/permease subunit
MCLTNPAVAALLPLRQVVALVGASGSGKSTFLALLQRLYEPQGGHLELDGVDIEQLDPTWLRGQIGVVEQEPALFSGTVGDAIRCVGRSGKRQTCDHV